MKYVNGLKMCSDSNVIMSAAKQSRGCFSPPQDCLGTLCLAMTKEMRLL